MSTLETKIPNLDTQKRIASALEKIAGEGLKQWNLETNHPVGSTWVSFSATNPGTIVGGTWSLIEQGRMLLAAGPAYGAGTTGGEAEHTLTVDEMPSHNHIMKDTIGITHNQGNNGTSMGAFTMTSRWNTIANGGPSDGYGTGTYTASSTGGGNSHNNMSPYIAVYIWRRTA